MKYLGFLFCLLSLATGLSAEEWTAEELSAANTASHAVFMTSQERDVVKYVNLARLYPRKFIRVEVEGYELPSNYVRSATFESYRQSLIDTLQARQPVAAVVPDEAMFLMARKWAVESGEAGLCGHDRSMSEAQFGGECCSYGWNDARRIVLSLLIDDGVESLGHRIICLSPNYSKLGVSNEAHKMYRYCSVLDFIW